LNVGCQKTVIRVSFISRLTVFMLCGFWGLLDLKGT